MEDGLFRFGHRPIVNSGAPKADVVVAVIRVVPIAVRGAGVPRVVVPGPAAKDALGVGVSTIIRLPD
nr:hypothetical protein [Azospirillum sp.]